MSFIIESVDYFCRFLLSLTSFSSQSDADGSSCSQPFRAHTRRGNSVTDSSTKAVLTAPEGCVCLLPSPDVFPLSSLPLHHMENLQ